MSLVNVRLQDGRGASSFKELFFTRRRLGYRKTRILGLLSTVRHPSGDNAEHTDDRWK